MFALMQNASADYNMPEYLGNDDSLVLGSDEDAENRTRIFVSYSAAQKYAIDNKIEDKFVPVSISVIQNESVKDEVQKAIDDQNPQLDEGEDDAELDKELDKLKETYYRKSKGKK